MSKLQAQLAQKQGFLRLRSQISDYCQGFTMLFTVSPKTRITMPCASVSLPETRNKNEIISGAAF